MKRKVKRLGMETEGPKVKRRRLKASEEIKREDAQEISPEVLTIDEVCKLLRVSPRAVYHLVRNKKIPALKVGTKFRFYKKAILEALSKIG